MMCYYVVWQVFMFWKLASGQSYKGERTGGFNKKATGALLFA